MSGLTPFLFGTPSLARDGVPLQLHSRQCMALLAVTGTSHRREALAALFWPEVDEGRARAALRSTHSRLRNTLGGVWLASDWETIGLDRDQQPVVDVVRFRSLPAQCGTHRHPADEACPHCLHLLAEASDVCRTDFLAGFTLRDSPQFDEGQSLESQTLRRGWPARRTGWRRASSLTGLSGGPSALRSDGRRRIPRTRQRIAA